jgi:DNA-binding phage protein
MATKTTPSDAARYISSLDSQAELLADALESGDAGYIANAIGVIELSNQRLASWAQQRQRVDRSGPLRRTLK